MTGEPTVTLTIAFNDPELDSEEREAQAQNLLAQMRDLDEIETVDRVLDPNPPEGNKAIGGMLVGLLMAEMSVADFKKLGGFFGERLGNKPVKLKVKAPDDRELELAASSQHRLTTGMRRRKRF
jgi:hypothetical protein